MTHGKGRPFDGFDRPSRAGAYTQARHGTVTGYQTHIRLRKPPCQPCRDASNRYRRELAARKKKAALSATV